MEGAKELQKNAQEYEGINATAPNNNLKSKQPAFLEAIELEELNTNQACAEEPNIFIAVIENNNIANIDTGYRRTKCHTKL